MPRTLGVPRAGAALRGGRIAFGPGRQVDSCGEWTFSCSLSEAFEITCVGVSCRSETLEGLAVISKSLREAAQKWSTYRSRRGLPALAKGGSPQHPEIPECAAPPAANLKRPGFRHPERPCLRRPREGSGNSEPGTQGPLTSSIRNSLLQPLPPLFLPGVIPGLFTNLHKGADDGNS